MPRRSYNKAIKGQVFASEWPQWHIECAVDECEEMLLVAAQGEAFTTKEAEKKLKEHDTEDESKDWTLYKGLWYCPNHRVDIPKKGKKN